MIKKLGKKLLTIILEAQVKSLCRRQSFKLIAVAGSVGKTSTKLAIAHLLSSVGRVRTQDGNYNDRLTVPLIFFNQQEPAIFNILAWLKLLLDNQRQLSRAYPYEYVVVELGTDAPGQMKAFSYLKPDILVLCALASEHMENFKTISNVIAEETATVSSANMTLINDDDCADANLENTKTLSYSLSGNSDYRLINLKTMGIKGSTAGFLCRDKQYSITLNMIGKQGAKISLAALAVVDILGLPIEAVTHTIKHMPPTSGRMQILKGINDSYIIDDSYNSSPSAVIAALDALYDTPSRQRIALLGSMNELGNYSKKAHEEIGSYCDPRFLSNVITLGNEANLYLAPAAKAQGCSVSEFTNAKEAGSFIATLLKGGSVILIKGSQNGVFAEEAIKPLLKNKDDYAKLVRQSNYWLRVKS